MRSSSEGVRTTQKRLTGERCNIEPVQIRGTLRYKRLRHHEVMAATGEDSHNCESRFTIRCLVLKMYSHKPLKS